MGANVTLEALASLASCLNVGIKDLVPENEFETLTPASISVTLLHVGESCGKRQSQDLRAHLRGAALR